MISKASSLPIINNFPQAGASLDVVKVLAAFLMVVDHINLLFLNFLPIPWMIGRAVFPLFCFIVALHVNRGIDRRSYILKLLPFAFITQVPYVWVLWDNIFESNGYNVVLNVIFTLGIGGWIALWLSNQPRWIQWSLCLAAILYALYLPAFSIVEYGTVGLLLPSVFLMVLRQQSYSVFLLGLMLLFLNTPSITKITPEVLVLFGIVLVILGAVFWLVMIVASQFSKKQRFLPRYFFHYFYPLHLLILGVLELFLP